MAIFKGKPGGLPALLERIKTRAYSGESELVELLDEIFSHPDARPKKVLWMLNSPNPTVRQKSLEKITALAGRSAGEILIQAMIGADLDVRRSLAKELVKVDDKQLYRMMGPLVLSKDKLQRSLALEIVAAHPKWHNFLSLLKRAVHDQETTIRVAATQILAKGANNPTVRMMLIRLLDVDDQAVRLEAIQSLGTYPKSDLVEPFFARMPFAEKLERHRMTETLSVLARDPKARMEEHVLPVLADENPDMRDAAVKLLANMPNQTRILRAFFLHSKGLATWLRSRTAASILKLSDSLVEPLRELLEDEDMDVRVGAMLMIGEAKDNSFVPLVVKMFQSDHDWWIRSVAVDVLAKHPNAHTVDTLLAEFHEPDLRYSIISALGKIPGPNTIPPLTDCLKDPQRGVRVAAVEALSNKPAEDVAELIFQVARDDGEKKVREKAAAVLLDFGPVSANYLKELDFHSTLHDVEDDDDEIIELAMTNETLNKTE